MKNNIAKFKKQEKGIALVLSVLVLANLFVITIIVTDVILRIGRTSRQISESEVAYFSAETAVEDAIYEIEQNQNGATLGSYDQRSYGYMDFTDGRWERYIEPIVSTRTICVDDQNTLEYYTSPNLVVLVSDIGDEFDTTSCVYAESFDNSNVDYSNPFGAIIAPGRSLEFDFDISTPEDLDFYPDYVVLTWTNSSNSSNPEGGLIVLGADGQISYNTATSNSIRVPSEGILSNNPSSRLRFINTSSSEHLVVNITPSTGDELPVGISVTGEGYFGNDEKERIIRVERRNWKIY